MGNDTSYFQLTGHYFSRLDHLCLLAIATGATQHEATCLREDHSEAAHIFRKTLGAEDAIKKFLSPLKKLVFQNFETTTPIPSLLSSPKF